MKRVFPLIAGGGGADSPAMAKFRTEVLKAIDDMIVDLLCAEDPADALHAEGLPQAAAALAARLAVARAADPRLVHDDPGSLGRG
jgi:hypothetical protein